MENQASFEPIGVFFFGNLSVSNSHFGRVGLLLGDVLPTLFFLYCSFNILDPSIVIVSSFTRMTLS